MADWVSSLLAGLGAGAESLGTSMTEREKRTAAANQRNMELSNEMAMKMAELGLSPDVNLPTSAAVQGIGNLRMTTPDPITSFAKNLSIGQDTGKSLAPSPRFDVFKGLEAASGDMSDAATNADMSGAGVRGPVSAYGAPTMPRTKLGLAAQLPNVQAEVNAPPMTTGAGDENLPRMSLIDPVTGESTRYKRDITQSLPYLSMQAQTKANEEREQVKQDAEGRRLAAAAETANARTLADKARAKQDKNRADFEYIRIVDRKNPSVQKEYNELTTAQQDSLEQIADTVKERDKIKTTADNKTPAAKFAQFVDGEGKLHYVTQETGAAAGWTLAPTGGGGGAGTAQSQTARLLAAVNEAQAAKNRMFAFEEKWLAGNRTPGTGNQIATSFAMTDAAKHPITQALGETVAQFGGQANADYLQYRRDAQLIARAEQLMSSRGGSEASVASNSLLARAIPGAGYKESIRAARQSREALFGKFGGVAQALTPAQLKKLADGLEASKRGDAEFDYASVGKDVGVTMDAHQARRTMTADQYANAIKAGYTDAEIIAQGYKLPRKP